MTCLGTIQNNHYRLLSWSHGISFRFVRILPSIIFLQGIMLVYDITSEKSFDNIKNWIRNIEEVRIDRHRLD